MRVGARGGLGGGVGARGGSGAGSRGAATGSGVSLGGSGAFLVVFRFEITYSESESVSTISLVNASLRDCCFCAFVMRAFCKASNFLCETGFFGFVAVCVGFSEGWTYSLIAGSSNTSVVSGASRIPISVVSDSVIFCNESKKIAYNKMQPRFVSVIDADNKAQIICGFRGDILSISGVDIKPFRSYNSAYSYLIRVGSVGYNPTEFEDKCENVKACYFRPRKSEIPVFAD